MKTFISTICSLILLMPALKSQEQMMTPELLWKIKRVSAVGLTKDKQSVIYKVTEYRAEEDSSETKNYIISVNGGNPKEIDDFSELLADKNLSPNKKDKAELKDFKYEKVLGKDYYPNYESSNMMIYNDLDYRHWDTWRDGNYKHLYIQNEKGETNVLNGEPYSATEFTWNPDGSKIYYVSKKKKGKEFALSTNSDIYEYDLKSKKTKNLTEGMPGYDTNPQFSSKGILAFASMARDGYEADKNDIIVIHKNKKINLTKDWDETIFSFLWNNDGDKIYFIAPTNGTIQLFEVNFDEKQKQKPQIKQITKGDFDVTGLVGESENKMIVSRTDMNHAAELYAVDLQNGEMKQLTFTNEDLYKNIKKSKTERRFVKTTDGKEMLVWMIYPPDFDPNKKYPTLLYCQGGPQSALTQFYSFRWNFQLMAANGYIIVAPNRRGMPGHGTAWNEQISKDWGGQVMDDYLSAIDDAAKEDYVDENRLGAVGASYGGYSVYYLAGIHNKRFKTFIAHDGVFNLQSMYGTTEEIFFPNWDMGGAYWETDNEAAMKTYADFNPINNVSKWDTPILIIQGGKDYRVPIGQSLEAFQAAQLHNIKSRLLYFPEENHWVLNPQNSIIWHSEFYRWLKETL